MARFIRTTLMVGLMVLATHTADAKPIGPTLFCDIYTDAPTCLGGQPACTFCHTSPPEKNVFGEAVDAALLPGTPRPLTVEQYTTNLEAALMAIEMQDSDGDGFNNIDEILGGTVPSDDGSFASVSGCPPFKRNQHYDVCFYDRSYVFKKVSLDFCAKSPTYDEFQAFKGLDESQQDAAIDARLSECLDSEAWIGKEGILWSMAHAKVRPLQAIKSGDNYGQIPLADYDDDYALFIYTQIDDHDARDTLLADYFAVRQEAGGGTTYVRQTDIGFNQSVARARRAGMLTTKWYLVLNVMFSQMPRTAAAQAYRAFLGMDIAKLEGLSPIPGEPVDYDNKGVDAPVCKDCHSTLDPLTYPFTKYHGLTGFPFGTYDPGRYRASPEAGFVLGQPVADLTEWAEVAANSNEFARAAVSDYWHLLLGERPSPDKLEDFEEFTALWRRFKNEHSHSVERMLRELIRTEAYGVP